MLAYDSQEKVDICQGNFHLSQPAHALPYVQVLHEIGANRTQGLTASAAKERFEEYGRNELEGGSDVQPMKILTRQVANAMILVLILAMVVSFGIRSWIEGGVISAVVVLNIVVGFFQEFQAEKTMDSLRSLSSPTANAIRDGRDATVSTAEIVPGDLVEMRTGDTVPADVRLITSVNFETDEALLTGEALPVQKDSETLFDEDVGAGDRINIAFSSTTVTRGRAQGVVFATGMYTEMGAIAAALRGQSSKTRRVKRKSDGSAGAHRYAQAWTLTASDAVGRFLGVNLGTPLQKKLSRLAILLFCIAVVCAIIVLGANDFSSKQQVIIYAVATGLSMIPASLIVVLTITMAAGTKNMVERHVIVRNLKSLEALGAVTELLDGNDFLDDFLNVASLANIATVQKSGEDWQARGDPTEIAIQVFATRFDRNRLALISEHSPQWRSIEEFPFDSDVKRMSAVYQNTSTQKMHIFTKGAVERVIESCVSITLSDEGPEQMTDDIREDVYSRMKALAALGLRVLALASKTLEEDIKPKSDIDRSELERHLIFRGLVGLYDPPRTESALSVRSCGEAGIRVHMLTGDHPGTARAIAREVNVLPTRDNELSSEVSNAMVMTASEFDKLSDEQVDDLPILPLVIARCTPNTKVRMIEALHRRKKFVAMTGDGVNDSPSLKQADVGIAMGQAGSDVAKDASDIVLTDDNFASILNAIEEGRRMFDNIQKFILHLLTTNIAQACTLLIGLAFKDASGISVFPLAPVEILWVIMITSSMPDMGLGFEIAAPDIMRRPPQSLKRGVFTIEVMLDMIVYGFWTAALCLASFALVLFGFGDGELGQDCNDSHGPSCNTVFRARATCFACMTWFALFLAWEMVDMRRSFFRMQPNSKKYFTQWIYDVWRNKFLFFAILAGFVTIFPTLYIPVINHDVFKHEGISWEWGIVFVECVIFFLGIETWKWAKRVYFRRQAGRHMSENDIGAREDDAASLDRNYSIACKE